MKATLTKEQRERLKPYERHLYSALYADYVVGLGQNITEGTLWPVYTEVFGEHPGRFSCNFCVMKVCKKLAKLYFETEQPQECAQKAPSSRKTERTVKSTTTEKKTQQKGKKTVKNGKK